MSIEATKNALAAQINEGHFIEFEVHSYDEQFDTFHITQTKESVDVESFDVDDFQIPAENIGHMLGFGEPYELIGRKFAIVPL